MDITATLIMANAIDSMHGRGRSLDPWCHDMHKHSAFSNNVRPNLLNIFSAQIPTTIRNAIEPANPSN